MIERYIPRKRLEVISQSRQQPAARSPAASRCVRSIRKESREPLNEFPSERTAVESDPMK